MELKEAPIDDMNKVWVGMLRWNMMVKVDHATVTAILDDNMNQPTEEYRKALEMKQRPLRTMKEGVKALGQRNWEGKEEDLIQDREGGHRAERGVLGAEVGEDQVLEKDGGEDQGLVAVNIGMVDDLVTEGTIEVGLDMIIGGMEDKEKWTVWKEGNAKKSVRGKEVEVEVKKGQKSETGRIEMIELTLMSGQPNHRMRKILG